MPAGAFPQLSDFDGKEFELTGVETGSVGVKVDAYGRSMAEPANTITFILDGVAYQALEDESDGYRSSMESLTIVDAKDVTNRFPPCVVRGQMGGGSQSEILYLVSVESGQNVIEVGTDNSDDYYPNFVGNFDPTAMPVNRLSRVESMHKKLKDMQNAAADVTEQIQRQIEAENQAARDKHGWGIF